MRKILSAFGKRKTSTSRSDRWFCERRSSENFIYLLTSEFGINSPLQPLRCGVAHGGGRGGKAAGRGWRHLDIRQFIWQANKLLLIQATFKITNDAYINKTPSIVFSRYLLFTAFGIIYFTELTMITWKSISKSILCIHLNHNDRFNWFSE